VGDLHRGLVKLTGLDAQPRAREARPGVHVWTLGEAEPFGSACSW
jgi:hypothetical protein